MIKRIAFTALMLIMVPAFAIAGTFSIAVTSGSTTGSVGPAPLSGYATAAKNFTATAAATYVLSTVKRNGVDVTANTTYVNGTTISIPLSTASQTFYVAFKKNVQVTPTLSAVLPGAITIPIGTPTALSGGNSTISNLNTGTQATYAFSGTGLTFSPVSAQVTDPTFITTNVTAAAAGTFTCTLTLTAPNATQSVANVTITVLSPGVIASNPCLNCHTGWAEATAYATSIHAQQASSSCQGCHNGALHPSDAQCATCHSAVGANSAPAFAHTCELCHNGAAADVHGFVVGVEQTGCTPCHGGGDTHKTLAADGCIGCHSIPITDHPGGLVADNNNGVRSITQEFTKWSHHVTGVTLNNAHCVACHLEGTVNRNGEVAVDDTYHMADNMTHLRNSDTDADMAWDPALPNHSTMDNYCMSCHDANGATSPGSQAIQAYINSNGIAAAGKTASALNPFGDTISNRYDKMQRPAVVNVDSQFNTTNNSHHAVKGPRYSGRTRLAGPRQIANPAAFANNSTAILKGVRSTIYDAGNLNQLYTPLENAVGETAPRTGALALGDDSTLHCGDCHTVGQWKAGSSETANGSPTPAAIGAHGSNNEYLLRNSIGTDERHTQNAFLQGNATGTVLMPAGGSPAVVPVGQPIPNGVVVYTNPNGAFLVCYNCHNYNKYGSIFLATGVVGGHVGEYDAAGRCNGIGNTIPFNGYTTGSATDGTQFESRFIGPITKYSSAAPYAGEQNPDFGNIFGIQCNNCHNSGAGNGYGGIHGSTNNSNTTLATVNPSVTGGAYIDGMGNTNKVQRFLPGLGNAMHVPGTLGGITGGTTAFKNGSTASNGTYLTGGISNDTNWEQKHWQQTANTHFPASPTGTITNLVSAGSGCYTLGTNATGNVAAGALRGASVTGAGGPETELLDTWGGCDDHNAKQGNGDHGFIKKIVRPVTY